MSLYDPDDYSFEDNRRFCMLRAMEWARLPLFISQPIAPLLLLFYDWWRIIAVIMLLSYLWIIIRDKFISIPIAVFSMYFVKLKWPSSLIMFIYFLIKGNIFLGLFSLFWPFISLLLIFLTGPAKLGHIERLFVEKTWHKTIIE